MVWIRVPSSFGKAWGNRALLSAILEREKWGGSLVPLFLMQCGGSLQGSFDTEADKKAHLSKNCFLLVYSVLYPDYEMHHPPCQAWRAVVGINGIPSFLTYHQLSSLSFKSRSKFNYSTFTVVFNNCIADLKCWDQYMWGVCICMRRDLSSQIIIILGRL